MAQSQASDFDYRVGESSAIWQHADTPVGYSIFDNEGNEIALSEDKQEVQDHVDCLNDGTISREDFLDGASYSSGLAGILSVLTGA